MATVASKLYSDDVSLLVLLLDTNPFFWSTTSITFSQFLSHVLAFLNAFLGLNQMNQVVVISTGYISCAFIYDSSLTSSNHGTGIGMPQLFGSFLENLENFVTKDEKLSKDEEVGPGPEDRVASSLLSGSLSMALCYILRVFCSGHLHPQPRMLCLQGSLDGPEQYVAVMNSIFSAQRLVVPIDSCYIGTQNSAFLQQASYITGGVHHKPQQLDGLFQYLMVLISAHRVFATRKLLIWATYVQYDCPSSVNITRNVQHAGLFLVSLNLMMVRPSLIRRGKLLTPKSSSVIYGQKT